MKLNRREFSKLFFFSSITTPSLLASTTNKNSGDIPNVLWLIGEDMGKQLGCYGTKGLGTPNLDRLAREGVRFENAFCTSSMCSPSRSSFNTGMYPVSIYSQDHRTAKQKQLPGNVKTISQWFSAAGYHSCLMGNPKKDFNFIPNGDVFESNDWTNRSNGQPFFCMYNFMEPHRWGWSQWEKLDSHIDVSGIEIPPVYADEPFMRGSCGKYVDFIHEMDRKVGVVIKRLEDEELLDNTIIIFIGDNGRTIYRGKQWLYDEGLSVPMICRYPSIFTAGNVRRDIVSLIDLAPTSLDLAGLEIPTSMQGQIIAGKNAKKRKYIFASRDLCDTTLDCIRCVRDDRYKYIRNYLPQVGYEICDYTKRTHLEWTAAKKLYRQGKLNEIQSLIFAKQKPAEELYDIQNDPWETKNLADLKQHKTTLVRMSKALDKWLEDVNDHIVTTYRNENI